LRRHTAVAPSSFCRESAVESFARAFALTPDYNPEAPRVILPGRGPIIEESAAALVDQRGPVPVYLKRAAGDWEYVGDYEVESSSRLPADIARYEAQTGRAVTSAIFMREAQKA
jgi:hypothetical protein